MNRGGGCRERKEQLVGNKMVGGEKNCLEKIGEGKDKVDRKKVGLGKILMVKKLMG
jgi:hypothetical protein